ncbi:MAG TPA: nitrogenase iron protein NifH [Clostridia bacterium]|nr:nitrogenase iron protein NifH [Clostridia bacterium]
MIKVAIYGKGGIGKSTTTSNLSAALAVQGYRVMQIGCDPKADSTKNLVGGRRIPTVLDQIKEKGDGLSLEDIAFCGFANTVCVESGGPTPGIGCAGRGIITAFNKLEALNAYEVFKPDIVFYDVLGDVVCGGFAMPIRGGYADRVFIVTSGEMMSLYAATNISHAIENFGNRGYAKFSGIILNSRNIENELALVQQAADEMNATIIKVVPRSPFVQQAENEGKTVIEAFPDCDMAQEYMDLATRLMEVCNRV